MIEPPTFPMRERLSWPSSNTFPLVEASPSGSHTL